MCLVGGLLFSTILLQASESLIIKDLKSRSKSVGLPFQLIPPEESGVIYRERPDMDKVRAKYAHLPEMADYGSIRGICFGDIDSDGLADLFLAYPFGGHRLYRNLGDFKFEDITQSAGILDLCQTHFASGCSFVDYDGDGDLDLFVCGSGDANLMLENQGNGKFRNQAAGLGLAHVGISIQMSFADYDQDGDLDGYLLTNRSQTKEIPPLDTKVKIVVKNGKATVEEKYRGIFDVVRHPTETVRIVPAGEPDYLLRNDNGVFKDVSEAVGISGTDEGLSASWFDYDDDGDPDLYVTNDFWGADQLYRNDNGRLVNITRESLPHIPWFSMGTAVGDINNDGRLDLFATDMAGSTHYKSKIGMGDMDASNWFLESSNPSQYMRNALYLNTGTGRFLEAAHMAGVASTDWTWSVQFADLDNDGYLDLYGTNGTTHQANHSDLKKIADSIKDPLEKANFWRKQGMQKERNFAFRNLGDLKFEKVSKEWGLGFLGVSYGAALADLDGDGDLDIAITSQEDPIRIYRNDFNSGNLLRIRLLGKDKNSHAIGAKVSLKTDTGLKIVRYLNSCQGYVSSSEPVLHFGLGTAKLIKTLTVRWPGGKLETFEDLPVNRLIEVHESGKGAPLTSQSPKLPTIFTHSNALSGFRHKENSFDDYASQPLLPHRLSRLGPGLALGDVDSDGDTDLFVGGATKQPGSLILNDGDGSFSHSVQAPFQGFFMGEDMGAVFFDADNDKDSDLFVASGGFDTELRTVFRRDRLHDNDGGLFRLAPRATENNRDSSGPVAPADFDKDGDVDLYVGGRVNPGQYPTSPISRILVNENGVFTDQSATVAKGISNTGMVTAALWSDVDSNGWLDLLIAHEWGAIQIWKNEKGRLRNVSSEAGTSMRSGWWTSLSGGDFDQDGDIDYIAGNLGLNTKYYASTKSPWLAYYGVFGDSSKPRFVEAKYEHGKLFPVRGKSCSTAAIPSLATKFTTFQKFARATLPEIYAAPKLAAAQNFEINELSTCLLRNDGTGKFTFEPLPRIAQISATFGTVVADVDADGNMDLCLAQNFYSMQPETGHVNGSIGLILKGDGSGNFKPVEATESGFVLDGDAKALGVADLNKDGRPDLVATRNNSTPALFHNTWFRGAPLAVQIRGNSGIGAKVKLLLESGNTLHGEIHGASGYLTGSDRTLYFGIPKGDSVKSVSIVQNSGKQQTISSPKGPRLEIDSSF